ncbi:MAG TPA: hypothetical protein VFG80_06935 [Myxococcota bacterium]|nr:hypothetical protein [Myxococcota bacterium]
MRFVLIGVAGANYYARSAASLFTTQDRDLFLPPDVTNTLAAWAACGALDLALESAGEPLGEPLDRELAERVVQRRASVRATDGRGLVVDLTYVMTGFDFESVERERRTFRVAGVEVPVASLGHIVRSKQATGRDKDRLFLASHADAIRDLLREDEGRE